MDAADTLYATRYNPTDGVAELPASDYSTPIASFGRSSPLGMSLGSDGTVYVSNYLNLDIYDRSQTETVDFGEVTAGSSKTDSTASVYNGGDQPLTISGFTLSGAGFSLDPSALNECASGTVLAPGTLCQASVIFTPGHPNRLSPGHRFLAKEVPGGKRRDRGFFAPLGDDSELCATILQIINSVGWVSLGEEECSLRSGFAR